MVKLKDLIKISNYEWEIPQSFREDMRVPVRLFATRELLQKVMEDKSLDQAVNAATLPGLVGHVVVMPDMHQGYGFPIGGVAATRYPDGVISPGAIGYDINCGVRLLGSQIDYDEVANSLDDLANALNQYCPSGVGEKGAVRLSGAELDQVCREGARWTLKKGFASEQDVRRTEEGGKLEGADPGKVSSRAKERGLPQLGSLGAGNHFIEVDLVEQVFDPEAAQVMGLQREIWWCRSTADHAGSATRSVRITWRNSRRRCGAMASIYRTASWFALRSIRRKGKITWQPCAARPTSLLQTANFWRTVPGGRSRKSWRGKCPTGICIRCMTLRITWAK